MLHELEVTVEDEERGGKGGGGSFPAGRGGRPGARAFWRRGGKPGGAGGAGGCRLSERPTAR